MYLNKCFHFLGLIKKMIQYVQPELLITLCSDPNENLGTLLVEVVATVLDNEVNISFQFVPFTSGVRDNFPFRICG